MKTIQYCWSVANGLGGKTPLRLFSALLGILFLKKLVGRSPMPILLRIGASTHTFFVRDAADIAALHEVFIDKEYEMPLESAGRIVDVGGHIGSATLFFATQYPDARIRAYEPDSGNFKMLSMNVGELPQVTCVNAAVSDKEGTIPFYVSRSSLGSSVLERHGARKTEVESVTLDSVLSEPVDLVKFDIEGAEYRMFAAAEKRSSIGALVGELHYDLMGANHETFVGLFEGYEHTVRPLTPTRALIRLKKK